jgi:ribosomal protein L34
VGTWLRYLSKRSMLAYAAEAGSIERHHVDVFAHIVQAAINEVAPMIARADDPAAAASKGENAVAGFLDRLLSANGDAGVSPRRQHGRSAPG